MINSVSHLQISHALRANLPRALLPESPAAYLYQSSLKKKEIHDEICKSTRTDMNSDDINANYCIKEVCVAENVEDKAQKM